MSLVLCMSLVSARGLKQVVAGAAWTLPSAMHKLVGSCVCVSVSVCLRQHNAKAGPGDDCLMQQVLTLSHTRVCVCETLVLCWCTLSSQP